LLHFTIIYFTIEPPDGNKDLLGTVTEVTVWEAGRGRSDEFYVCVVVPYSFRTDYGKCWR
jgi:hypothetical protein